MRIVHICLLLALFIWLRMPVVTAQQAESSGTHIEVTSARLGIPMRSTSDTTLFNPVITRSSFDGVVFSWQIQGNPNHIRLSYRVKINDTWQNWQPLPASDEFQGETAPYNEYTSTMYSIDKSAQAWQVSLTYTQHGSTYLSAMRATTMSSLHIAPRIAPRSRMTTSSSGTKPAIVVRSTWGGNTVQEWDARGDACASSPSSCPANATWMPASSEIGIPTHIIIHHTATPNYHLSEQNTNWSSIVRNIWQYHSMSLNWGDVGYHYLIDPNGIVYEGRYTGVRDDGTVINGAHAYGFNYGSIGISMIGTYSSVQPTPAAQASLQNMLSWLASKYNIQPNANMPYRPHPANTNYSKYVDYDGGAGVTLNTIEGHRVTGSIISQILSQSWNTTCPGDTMFAMLPNIRNKVVAETSPTANKAQTAVALKATNLAAKQSTAQARAQAKAATAQAKISVRQTSVAQRQAKQAQIVAERATKVASQRTARAQAKETAVAARVTKIAGRAATATARIIYRQQTATAKASQP